MQQLTNLDASFLHLESSRTPMHIGCILSFSAPTSGEMTFERFKCFIKARLSISPIFRRRISTHIFNMDQPVWVDAADFNIDQHVFEKVLDRGWHKHQTNELINNFFSKTLDKKRPLWEMLFFKDEENSNEQFHVLLKFHHAAVDGMSAEKILSDLLSPENADQNGLNDSWMPASLPLSNKVFDITGKQIRNIYESPNKLLHLIQRLGHSALSSQALRFLDKEQHPPHFFTAPETPFNHEITYQHDLVSTHLSLDKIKAIRKAYPGSTINDVVLSICSGALREHLNRQGKLPEQALVAMIPVSKRPKEQTTNGDNTNGNLISPMLVSLATDLDTATARLGMIKQNTMCNVPPSFRSFIPT